MIRKLFLLWGADDDGDGDGDGDGEPTSTPESKPEVREISQDELDKMTARAADKAVRKARREMASEMGFDNLGGLKEFVEGKQAADEAATDEQTKVLQEAERSKKENQAATSALAEKSLGLTISMQVVAAGVADQKKVQRIAALVREDLDSDLLNDEDGWIEAVASALHELQDDMPELFIRAGTGSGDGGAHGESTTELTEEEKVAASEKVLRDEYESKGLIYHPFPK